VAKGDGPCAEGIISPQSCPSCPSCQAVLQFKQFKNSGLPFELEPPRSKVDEQSDVDVDGRQIVDELRLEPTIRLSSLDRHHIHAVGIDSSH
jgi:hypothetical protein